MSSTHKTQDNSDLSSTPPSTPPTPHANPLADVFEHSDHPDASSIDHSSHPSDIPRLRSQHSTAGYRDGIAAAKEKSLQPGFDEGFSLGATFGLKAGALVGELEGLCLWKGDGAQDVRIRLRALLSSMRDEISCENLFAREWWGQDGLWKYPITVVDAGREEADATFKDIVDSHPMILKWQKIVDLEMQQAGVKRDIFEGAEWEAGRVDL